MTNEELEEAFTFGILLRIYTGRIGRFVEGRVCVLHWPVTPDAFLFEATKRTDSAADQASFYWVQRSDASLIVETA
jgi:hypothetical protein